MTNYDNSVSIRNGLEAEKIAKEHLKIIDETLIYTNDIFDFMMKNSIPIEVKSCNFKTYTSDRNPPYRYGRFCLEYEQHKQLKEKGGYYLFIVRLPCGCQLLFIMPAKAVKWQRRPSWRVIYAQYQKWAQSSNMSD